ncbi:MAG: phosphopantetheine-binding protein [Pseudomonadota bacterium]
MTEVTSEDAVLQRVIELISAKVKPGISVTPETRILADTNLDSVSVMDAVLELEDEFDITIPLNSLSEVETVEQLAGAVEALVQQ